MGLDGRCRADDTNRRLQNALGAGVGLLEEREMNRVVRDALADVPDPGDAADDVARRPQDERQQHGDDNNHDQEDDE
jgi:hypothetical protein